MAAKLEIIFFITIVAAFTMGTLCRNAVWLDKKTIWLNAVQRSPSKARPHASLGMTYDRNGDTDRAEQEYARAISLEPDYLSPYGPLAVVYGKKGDIDRAIQVFLWVIPRMPVKDAKLHTGLGAAYMIKGLLSEAERALQEALAINPYYELAHYNLARIYEQTGLREAALKHYKMFLRNAGPQPNREMIEEAEAKIKGLSADQSLPQ